MVNKRKIAVVTGARAEYGLLSPLMRTIKEDSDLELQVIVTGMHLSPEFGLTYQLIEKDGFEINSKVEMLLSSDSSIGTAKSIGLGVIGFSETIANLCPDIIILLGDRFEALAVAMAALVQKIPIAHIHGGELSEGAIDDSIRHSITKMSHLHFVSAEPYRERVIQLGESPGRVFNVGSLGLERISKTGLLTRQQLENAIDFSLGSLNFLVTYHPTTLETENTYELEELFSALDHFPEARIIFTKANADELGRYINTQIDQYVLRNKNRAKSFVTLGDLNYLSVLQFVDVVIGNSSSGLIEVPYFKKPTVNVGNRQLNRLRTKSVIDCVGKRESIVKAIELALSKQFKELLRNISLPYTYSNTAIKIKKVLKETDLKKIVAKRFYDLKVKEIV